MVYLVTFYIDHYIDHLFNYYIGLQKRDVSSI